jgi:hypothetical protein
MTVQHLESLYPDRSEWLSHCEQFCRAITLPITCRMITLMLALVKNITLETQLNHGSS